MNYLILEDNLISNIIVAEPDIAAELGAVPSYDGASIGEPYAPPHIYTDVERAQQATTDLQLSGIESGQATTDLQLSDIAQGQHITDLELSILEGKA